MIFIAILSVAIAGAQLAWNIHSDLNRTPDDPLVSIRLSGGMNIMASEQFDEISHYGARIMRNNGTQRYGFEVSRFNFKDSTESAPTPSETNAYGLVFEQKLGSGMIASFGVMGHNGYGEIDATPVGTAINIGWEPKIDWMGQFQPYLGYRGDIIFAEDTDAINSVSLGITWNSAP